MPNVSAEASISYWMKSGPMIEAVPLAKDEVCDVAIVGGGIAGLSTAYELTRLGRSVVLIDRGTIGFGMTARTTAHLASELDDRYSELIRIHGRDAARLYHDSQMAAINRIEAICAEETIHADFKRVDGYLAAATPDDISQLRDEREACHTLGISVEWVERASATGLGDGHALLFPRQARFHPLKYLAGLAAAAARNGARFYADTAYTGHETTDDGITLQTEPGKTIRASHAVFATNTPVSTRFAIHTKQRPDRTYVIAGPVPQGSVADVLLWDTLDNYHYVRLQPQDDGTDLLIVGGEDHRSGESNDMDQRLARLESWARQQFPMLGEVAHRWSGQVMEPVDYMPFSGRDPGNDRVFLHTGDSGQGITNGVAGSLVIAPLITGHNARFADLFDPARKPHSASSLASYVSDQAGALASAAAVLTPSDVKSEEDIKPGEGALMRDGAIAKQAVFRKMDGTLVRLSALCPHAGCTVQWNSFEKCWDCPCHGSQFAADGTVLNGPALQGLQQQQD